MNLRASCGESGEGFGLHEANTYRSTFESLDRGHSSYRKRLYSFDSVVVYCHVSLQRINTVLSREAAIAEGRVSQSRP